MKIKEKGARWKTSRVSYVSNYFLTILLFLLLMILGFTLDVNVLWVKLLVYGCAFVLSFLILEPEVEKTLREYIITNNEVMKIEGIFRKKKTSIPFGAVADVKLIKGFTGMLFNFGDVEVSGFKDKIKIKGIKDPDEVYKIIENKIALLQESKRKKQKE